jgi:hypothetical protein
MTRGTFFLLAPVVVAAAIVFVWHDGNPQRADYFFFQVMGLAVLFWILLGVGNGVRCAIRDRRLK